MKYKEKVQNSGRSVTWLARQIGISRVLLSNYINENRKMPDSIEQKLKPFLNSHLPTQERA